MLSRNQSYGQAGYLLAHESGTLLVIMNKARSGEISLNLEALFYDIDDFLPSFLPRRERAQPARVSCRAGGLLP